MAMEAQRTLNTGEHEQPRARKRDGVRLRSACRVHVFPTQLATVTRVLYLIHAYFFNSPSIRRSIPRIDPVPVAVSNSMSS